MYSFVNYYPFNDKQQYYFCLNLIFWPKMIQWKPRGRASRNSFRLKYVIKKLIYSILSKLFT